MFSANFCYSGDVRSVEFWFEFASSYTYPAAMRVEALAKQAGVKIVWRPFLLGPIFQARFGTADSPFNRDQNRLQYMWRDLQRHCDAYGLTFRLPSQFPRGSLLGARVALAAADEGWIGDFVRAMFHANYVDDRDIGSEALVTEILEKLGQSAKSWLERATSDDNKNRLKAQNQEAVQRGIFGAPTLFAGEEMFWGNDRVEHALAWPALPRIEVSAR